VASVNGATKLILNHEVSPQVDARAFRHLNQFPNLLFPIVGLSEVAQAVPIIPPFACLTRRYRSGF
jgi:hypothetical protein